METLHVFLSVGSPATADQEEFICAVEERLRAEGIQPHTVGRNAFSADAPLKAVTDLMDQCVGTVVIALERSYFPSGLEKRGGENQREIVDTRLPTPWNQLEAAMAYSRGHALMVIVEDGLKLEGLLQTGYDWFVQRVRAEPAALGSVRFSSILNSWKAKLIEAQAREGEITPAPSVGKPNPADLTLGELIGGLKPAQVWALLVAQATLLAGAFALGARLLGS